jgi:hypothetical protein
MSTALAVGKRVIGTAIVNIRNIAIKENIVLFLEDFKFFPFLYFLFF